jgi:hypothetical protein
VSLGLPVVGLVSEAGSGGGSVTRKLIGAHGLP